MCRIRDDLDAFRRPSTLLAFQAAQDIRERDAPADLRAEQPERDVGMLAAIDRKPVSAEIDRRLVASEDRNGVRPEFGERWELEGRFWRAHDGSLDVFGCLTVARDDLGGLEIACGRIARP